MALTPPIKRRNYGRGHAYHDANGVKVPGVTTICDTHGKPGLVGWAARKVAETAVDRWDELSELTPIRRYEELKGAANADRDEAAGRGTQVHGLASQLVHGEEVEVPEELAGHVDAYVRFLNEWEPRPRLVEATVVNYRWTYAGTLDLLADMDPFGCCLLDIKTSRSRVYGDTALQVAAYRYAEKYVGADGKERPMPKIDATFVVWVRSDGYDLLPIVADERAHRAFLYLAEVTRWDRDERDSAVAPALHPRDRRALLAEAS